MSRIGDDMSAIRSNIGVQLTALVTTAFGLVAALAWNTAIQALFAQVFGKADTLAPMFGYAILVTIIAVIVTYYVSRLSVQNKKT